MKMQSRTCVYCGLLMSLLLPVSMSAQQGTGFPVLGSFGGGPADTVNLYNLNVHYQIPVFSRPGRGILFPIR